MLVVVQFPVGILDACFDNRMSTFCFLAARSVLTDSNKTSTPFHKSLEVYFGINNASNSLLNFYRFVLLIIPTVLFVFIVVDTE
jgi:hypothetical protein